MEGKAARHPPQARDHREREVDQRYDDDGPDNYFYDRGDEADRLGEHPRELGEDEADDGLQDEDVALNAGLVILTATGPEGTAVEAAGAISPAFNFFKQDLQ